MLLQQVLRCGIKVYHLRVLRCQILTPLETRFASVREGAGILTHEEICPELHRRLLVTCTMNGAALHLFRDRLLMRQRSSYSRKRNRYWCPWDATPIVNRCVVKETEETEEAQESFDTLLCWRLLSMLHRGNILRSRAT